MSNQIGFVFIEQYKTEKKKVCEAPRHKGLELPAYAVIAVASEMYHRPFTQMICEDCWKYFDAEIQHDWNLGKE